MQAMVPHLPYGFLNLAQGRLYRLIAIPSLQFSRLGQKTSFIPGLGDLDCLAPVLGSQFLRYFGLETLMACVRKSSEVLCFRTS
jgi:hypothetical protein